MKKMADAENPTLGDAIEVAAKEGGPLAARVIGDFMEASARERDAITASLLRSAEQRCDEWRERALKAERQLTVVQERLEALIWTPSGEPWRDE